MDSTLVDKVVREVALEIAQHADSGLNKLFVTQEELTPKEHEALLIISGHLDMGGGVYFVYDHRPHDNDVTEKAKDVPTSPIA